MGCPVKVCRVGGGSAMMTELDRTAHLVRTMVQALKIPVTAKMRLGWDDENQTAPGWCAPWRMPGRRGLHPRPNPRTGLQRRVSLKASGASCRGPKHSVIGNGDVTTPEAARVMIETTGCAG